MLDHIVHVVLHALHIHSPDDETSVGKAEHNGDDDDDGHDLDGDDFNNLINYFPPLLPCPMWSWPKAKKPSSPYLAFQIHMLTLPPLHCFKCIGDIFNMEMTKNKNEESREKSVSYSEKFRLPGRGRDALKSRGTRTPKPYRWSFWMDRNNITISSCCFTCIEWNTIFVTRLTYNCAHLRSTKE